MVVMFEKSRLFLSTLPARGATQLPAGLAPDVEQFLSTLPARGATSIEAAFETKTLKISIHAPREGSDGSNGGGNPGDAQISIHAPREGSDQTTTKNCQYFPAFLSTLPARGATRLLQRTASTFQHFYPRSPRGERRCGSTGKT